MELLCHVVNGERLLSRVPRLGFSRVTGYNAVPYKEGMLYCVVTSSVIFDILLLTINKTEEVVKEFVQGMQCILLIIA
jgi:hypothetical protein